LNRWQSLSKIQLGNKFDNLGKPEIYNEKAFDLTDLRPKKPLLNAKFVGQNSLMFNVHPTLGSSHINKTIDILNDIFHKAKR